jgi:DNA topoisomerase IA
MIAYAAIDFVLDSDTIVLIETRRNDEIGGFPDYYVYASNHRQVKYYSGLDERKTYTLEELCATGHESLPPKPYPQHWTSKKIEEMKKGSPSPIRDIIFSIQSNSLGSCIIDIGKLNYTPSRSYEIVIAIMVDSKYVFQYFSVMYQMWR